MQVNHTDTHQAAAYPSFVRATDLQGTYVQAHRAQVAGDLERVAPGVYLPTSGDRHPLAEPAAWTLRHPHAVISLLTAAVHHDLTDAFARGIWLSVPTGTTRPTSTTVRIHVCRARTELLDPSVDRQNGIETIDVHGARCRITGPDRTVADLFRYPNRISREHALIALKRRIRTEGFVVGGLARIASRVGVWDEIEPVLQGAML